LKRVAAALGDAVAEVRASARLTESPSCLTRPADGMSESMRRILAAAGRDDMPASKPILELNMTHPLVQRLAGLEGEDFSELSQLLYDQGQLTEQGQLANPGDYARRLNRLLLKLLA
jgi:molecular chaperone HtpG